MTDQQQFSTSSGTSDSGRDVTAVMGRRIAAWVLDLLIFLGISIALFALQAEYVDLSNYSGALGDACPALQDQYGDLASSCFEINDRAYITTGSESALQTGATFAYWVAFVVIQGLVGGSPGKLAMGLRVVREDGSRAGVGRSLVRTLLWIVDGAPWFAPLVGFIVGITSTGHRRVGDIVAKTYVVARKDVGAPVLTSAAAAPPGQASWGAPPAPQWPAPAGPPAQAPPPPTPAPAPAPAPDSWSAPAPPATPTPVDPTPPPAAGPPPLPTAPHEAAAEPAAPVDAPVDEPTPEAATASAESSSPADQAPPDVGFDPDWYRGPEADPTSTSFESGSGEAPSVEPDVAAPDLSEPETWSPTDPSTEWTPPTTPTADIETGDDTSPTAGPTGFVAPGADAPVDRPPTQSPPGSIPQASQPMPPPQWDQARNTYIQWDPAQQSWLQWDAVANRWKLIDT